MQTKLDKRVFQELQRRIITVKFGSDLVVGSTDLNQDLLRHVAEQAHVLNEKKNDLLIVSSGAVKYGRILAKKDNDTKKLSKVEAAFTGYDLLMEAWLSSFQSVGLWATAFRLTGQSFTSRNIAKIERQIKMSPLGTAYVANTHDGLNSRRHKHFEIAANNDMVGERLATSCSETYIICTNVDGVLDKHGNSIREFQSLEQLNDVVFHNDLQSSGTGGMETKLWAAIRYALSQHGRAAYIVDGREKNILLKVMDGEQVGTKVQLQEGGQR